MPLEYPITAMYIDQKWPQRPQGDRIPRYTVAHDTGNPGSTALQNAKYFNSRALSASVHTFIDDRNIIETIPLWEKAWHVRRNVSDAIDWAIGVELCYGGTINFNEAYKRYVWYFAYLCRRFNLDPLKQIKGHFQLDPTRRTDPVNALSKYGKTYQGFLNDVNAKLKGIVIDPPPFITKRRGDQGEAIVKLQKDLAFLGYYKGGIDGDFGPLTEKAVMDFQRDAKIQVDGIFGPITAGAIQKAIEDKKLNHLLKIGDKGDDVLLLQEKLICLKYNIVADGIYGSKTDQAVRQFQAKNGLKVDGIYGPVTKKAMDVAVEKECVNKPTPPKVPITPKYLYKVQIGAFHDLNNAKQLENKAKQSGFNAVIITEPIE